jgi:hypothetical protein
MKLIIEFRTYDVLREKVLCTCNILCAQKQTGFYALSSHNFKTSELILIKFYIGAPCTTNLLNYVKFHKDWSNKTGTLRKDKLKT